MDRNDKVFQSEYLFLVICFTLSYIRVLSFTDKIARNDSWLVIIAGAIICVPFILVYTGLAKRFPSKTLLEIYRIVFGKAIGTVVSVLYILLFLMATSHFLNDLSEYFTEFVQTETPPLVFIIMTVVTSAIILRIGILYLIKMSVILTVFSLTVFIFIFFLLLGKMDFSNLMPVLAQKPKVYLEATANFALNPGCQSLFLLMYTPQLRSTRHLTKTTLTGALIGIFMFLFVSIRNTAVLGPMAAVVNSSSFAAARMIEIGDIFTRLDFAVSTNITLLSFFVVNILYYAAVKGLTQLLGLKSINWCIIPVGVIVIILAMTLFDSSIGHAEYARKFNTPLYSAFHVLFPPAALLTAKLRKLKDS